jgi:hypothetical protein
VPLEWCGGHYPSAHDAAASFGRCVLREILHDGARVDEIGSYRWDDLKALEPLYRRAHKGLTKRSEYARSSQWLIAECEREVAEALGGSSWASPTPDLLATVRAAIERKGRSAKAGVVLKEAGIREQAGRKALRQLEALGEYAGFGRRKPRRMREPLPSRLPDFREV